MSAASAVGEVAMSWLVGFAAIVLIFSGDSHSFYDPEPARG